MKKNIYKMLALMAGTCALAACSSDDAILNENVTPVVSEATPILSFMAQTEDGATRATIEGTGITWQAGDAIIMFDGTSNAKYNLDDTSAGTTSGTFTVDESSTAVSGSDIYALYPYTVGNSTRPMTKEDLLEAVSWGDDEYYLNLIDSWQCDYEQNGVLPEGNDESYDDLSEDDKALVKAFLTGTPVNVPGAELVGNSITKVVLPAQQQVAAGQNVDPKAVLMVAKAEGESLSFKNVCSYIKVTPTAACSKIVVSSHNGEPLAGTLTVAVSDTPTASVTANGSNQVTLSGDITAGKDYYIAVLPGTLTKGLDIKFYETDLSTVKYSTLSTSYTLGRNLVHNGGSGNLTGAVWSQKTYIDAWAGDNYYYTNASLVTFETEETGDMPSGATALNDAGTLWVEHSGTKYTFKTTADRIFATSLSTTFANLGDEFTTGVTIEGLDKIDVSAVDDFSSAFAYAKYLGALDLSTWQIQPEANTASMFLGCTRLGSLTLNNTFESGNGMFSQVGKNLTGGKKCVVYGVTDSAVKSTLRSSYTAWDDTYIMFDGE